MKHRSAMIHSYPRSSRVLGAAATARTFQKPNIHPAIIGIGAGIAAASTVGLITYYGAKIAGRLAGPLGLLNGILAGGVIGYLAGTKYAE